MRFWKDLGYIASTCIAVLGCEVGLPPLQIETQRDSVTIHLETLGEYPTSVSRLVLTEVRSGDTLWEVRKAPAGIPQLWRITFRAGSNPTEVTSIFGDGSLEVVEPKNAASFELEAGREYQLRIWSESGRSSRTASFTLPSSADADAASTLLRLLRPGVWKDEFLET